MPSETIVAVFETARAAEAAIAALVDGGVSENAIHHYVGDTDAGTATGASGSPIGGSLDEPPARTAGGGGGFWGWLTGENPEHAHHHGEYDRSIGTGRQVVTVIAQESEAPFVLDILDRHDPLDIEQHGAGATAEAGGLAVPATGAASMAATPAPAYPPNAVRSPDDAAAPGHVAAPPVGSASRLGDDATIAAPSDAGRPVPMPVGTAPGARTEPGVGADLSTGAEREQVLALSEEQLEVGKRQVDRGTTRVRRYVVERPVEEQIRLRDEAVSVFRRPVARRAAAGADAFTDRTVEMTETDEEAVVSKQAFVAEEVVLRKDLSERDEVVRDTLRKEEVEITGPGGSAGTDTTVAGATGRFEPKKDI